MLVDVLLVVGDEGLGDGLTDGVDLGSVATTGDADADVDVGELVKTDDQEGLVDLKGTKSQRFVPLAISCLDILASCQAHEVSSQSQLRFDVLDDSRHGRRRMFRARGEESDSYLEAQDLGLDQRKGTSVDLDETTASLNTHHVSRPSSFAVSPSFPLRIQPT